MPTQEEIYKTEGDKYEALIAREDYQGNIMRALREIAPLENRVFYDLGAGTGRLACMLAPYVLHVRAFDISEEMLRGLPREIHRQWIDQLAGGCSRSPSTACGRCIR